VDDFECTPSESGPPPSPAELTLKILAGALRETSDSYVALLEVCRGLPPSQRDSAISHAAELARDCKHLAGEAEQLLQALVGFRSDRIVTIVPKGEHMTGLPLFWKLLIGVGMSLSGSALAKTWGEKWSPIVGGVGTILTGVGAFMTNSPAQKTIGDK
jgi:hypothetical protein